MRVPPCTLPNISLSGVIYGMHKRNEFRLFDPMTGDPCNKNSRSLHADMNPPTRISKIRCEIQVATQLKISSPAPRFLGSDSVQTWNNMFLISRDLPVAVTSCGSHGTGTKRAFAETSIYITCLIALYAYAIKYNVYFNPSFLPT